MRAHDAREKTSQPPFGRRNTASSPCGERLRSTMEPPCDYAMSRAMLDCIRQQVGETTLERARPRDDRPGG
jgi:hypothetical protein